ncbi:MAG TPA: Uma2 family endonuclease [Thermoanaerobaculia bacterium]|nr:Uma2 family endonuclease [Thermoanaerobaculia bacterium]
MPGRAAIGSTTPFTAGELAAVPNPDLPHELWHGVLRLVMPASAAHGWAVSRLTVMLGQFVYAHDLGELFSESTGFLLERGPDTLLCPDVAFVAKERLPAGALGSPFLEIAPDLAVEVLSAGDRPAAVRAKVAEYLRLGVRCVWVVDPAARRMQLHARDADPGNRIATSELREGDVLDGREILPGFRQPLAELFSTMRR